MSLCFASAGVVKTLSVMAFTLVWTHSIEKVDGRKTGALPRRGCNWNRPA